jgi:hypothetical protein
MTATIRNVSDRPARVLILSAPSRGLDQEKCALIIGRFFAPFQPERSTL